MYVKNSNIHNKTYINKSYMFISRHIIRHIYCQMIGCSALGRNDHPIKPKPNLNLLPNDNRDLAKH